MKMDSIFTIHFQGNFFLFDFWTQVHKKERQYKAIHKNWFKNNSVTSVYNVNTALLFFNKSKSLLKNKKNIF